MTIKPDDGWYPSKGKMTRWKGKPLLDAMHVDPGVTIRLKLAAEFAAAIISPEFLRADDTNAAYVNLSNVHHRANAIGLLMADDLIDRANRDEGSDDGIRTVDPEQEDAMARVNAGDAHVSRVDHPAAGDYLTANRGASANRDEGKG